MSAIPSPPDPVALAPGERIVGWQRGAPVVRHPSGKAGLTVGVVYDIDDVPYDDREAFEPRPSYGAKHLGD